VPGLPRDHILRPRLTGVLAASALGVVEAGSGYGKTTLAAELALTRGIASVMVPLDERHSNAAALIGALRSAMSRAGWSDAATVLADADDPLAAMDALAELLEDGQELLIVFDNAHHLTGESDALMSHLAQRWPACQHLLLVARHLPSELRRIRHLPGSVLLDSTDLALTYDEVAELAGRSRLTLTRSEVEQLVAGTDGWAAAVVLALPLLARASVAVEAIAELRRRSHSIAELVDEHLAHLPTSMRAPVARALQLPLITASVVEAATGFPDLLSISASAGLPVTITRDGTWLVPHPVGEALAALEPLDAATAHRAAAEYERLGEAEHAIRVLLKVGDSHAAAAAVESLRPPELDHLGLTVLSELVRQLTPEAVAAHPHVLLHVARACEPVAAVRERSAVLEQLAALAAGTGNAALLRAAQAEQSRDLVREDDIDLGEELASRVLEHAQPDELETRVRALDVLGRAQAWRRDPASMQRAERLLTEAIENCRRLGQTTWAAQVVLPLAINVHYARGDCELAVRRIDEALAELDEGSVHRPVMLTFRAEVLINFGRYDESSASLSVALNIATRRGDDRAVAYAHWEAAKSASQRGDVAVMVGELEAVETHRADWFQHCTGAEFLADAADLCDRVGRSALARSYAERALERRADSPAAIDRSLAAIAARTGDPFNAERALTAATTLYRLEPRERWRITLLRAFAALRRGDPRAGPLAARAFDEAAAMGYPGLPLLRERAAAEALVDLAAVSGSVAASELRGRGPPVAVTLLGRFRVTRGGQPIAGLEGRPAQAVKVVATLGASTVDVVSEALWQDADSEGGRRRLRNVLTRLRDAAGDIVIREGNLLRLADDAVVDADLFEQEARRAIALGSAGDQQAAALGRAALARYVGDLLPGDGYLDWTAARRERLRALSLDLLDLLAAHDAARGDANEAVRLLEKAIEADPYEETRYVLLAGIHRQRGATGRALEVARRGLAAMRELGVAPSPALSELGRVAQG
jgi:ATP/maltotriose-dependent transcriptional regulator MalT/DNA-binding SARP family transcriptional activator